MTGKQRRNPFSKAPIIGAVLAALIYQLLGFVTGAPQASYWIELASFAAAAAFGWLVGAALWALGWLWERFPNKK